MSTLITLQKNLYSATFFDTTLQTNGGATTANQVKINTQQQGNGFTLLSDSITVLNSAVYFISASMQLAFTGGASNYNVTVWFTVNNVIVPNSSFTFTTTGATGIGTVTGLPSGVSASFAGNTITVGGTPTQSGSFTYSIPLTGGCSAVTGSGTITVTPQQF
jgi:hypothetical protein